MSVADIVTFVSIYKYFAKIKDNQKYSKLLNVSRWFDIIQFNISKSSNVLQIISISKSIPKSKANNKKNKKDKDKKGKDKKQENQQQQQPKKGEGGGGGQAG